MAILSSPVAWRRVAKRDIEADLTATEQKNVRTALRFLAKRLGTYGKLAEAMKAKRNTVMLAAHTGTVSAGIALRASRAACVPLETVLAGAWPRAGMCPHCGRG